MLSGLRDWFLEQLAMYAAYHRDRRNQATHHVGVPLIVFSLLLALTRLPITETSGFTLNVAMVVLGLLLLLYVLAVPLTGIFTAIFYGAVYGVVLRIARESDAVVWTTAGAGFVAGWATQFIGHAFEGRRPALTVNALQVFMAPPFLIAEMLMGVGLEQELKRNIESRAVKYLASAPPTAN